MKPSLLTLAALAAFSTALHAQSFIPASGWSAVKLFETSASQTVSGLEFDAAGNVYYLLGDNVSPTQLLRRSPGDAYASATPLFSYAGPVFGSFVRENAGRLYFGESTAGTIRTFDLGTSAVATLATVEFNYDLDFAGGVGWLSANPAFAGNKVMKLDLATGATTTVLTSPDSSGPVAIDDAGQIYYGVTGYGAGFLGAPEGVFRYTLAEALAGGLTLDAGHKWVSNTAGSAYFDFAAGQGLYETDFYALNLLDTTTGAFTAAGTVGGFSESMGQLAFAGDALAVTVTEYGSFASADDKSAVFRVVPEPASAALLALSVALVLRRRRA